MKTTEKEHATSVKQQTNFPMIFIVGNSRSGTTMMGRILGNNPNVFTFHELHFFEQLWSTRDSNRLFSKKKGEKLLLCKIDKYYVKLIKKMKILEKLIRILICFYLEILNILLRFVRMKKIKKTNISKNI